MKMNVALLFSVAAALLLVSCGPPLRLEPDELGLLVTVEFLGEYPTKVGRITIKGLADGVVVLDLKGGENPPELWKFRLKSEGNSIPLQHFPDLARYETIVSAGMDSFVLEEGVTYVLEICGVSDNRCSSARFRLQPGSGRGLIE